MFSDPIITDSVDIDIFDTTTPAQIELTEGGSIEVEFPDPVEVNPGSEEQSIMGSDTPKAYEFKGTAKSGTDVTLQNVIIHPSMEVDEDTSFFVRGIDSSELIIDSSGGSPIVDKEVTVEIDMMSFQPSNPQRDHVENQPLLTRNDWTIYGHSLSDRKERIKQIKEFQQPLRTATIEIQQEVNGPPSRQVEKALEKLEEIIELVSFIQGTEPAPIRARVTTVDGQQYPHRYEEWFSTYRQSIGHSFVGSNLIWGDLRLFLDDAYDDYLNKRDKYRLNLVISWYLDALNTTRTIDTKMASLCSGIELFAKRYSDHGPGYYETKKRIGYLVNEIGVDTKDLAEFSGTYDITEGEQDSNKSIVDEILESDFLQKVLASVTGDSTGDVNYGHEYFYSYSRQYVVHGDNLRISFDELFKDYEATKTLFQRLLTRQLLGGRNLENYPNLGSLFPEDSRYKQ